MKRELFGGSHYYPQTFAVVFIITPGMRLGPFLDTAYILYVTSVHVLCAYTVLCSPLEHTKSLSHLCTFVLSLIKLSRALVRSKITAIKTECTKPRLCK